MQVRGIEIIQVGSQLESCTYTVRTHHSGLSMDNFRTLSLVEGDADTSHLVGYYVYVMPDLVELWHAVWNYEDTDDLLEFDYNYDQIECSENPVQGDITGVKVVDDIIKQYANGYNEYAFEDVLTRTVYDHGVFDPYHGLENEDNYDYDARYIGNFQYDNDEY